MALSCSRICLSLPNQIEACRGRPTLEAADFSALAPPQPEIASIGAHEAILGSPANT